MGGLELGLWLINLLMLHGLLLSIRSPERLIWHIVESRGVWLLVLGTTLRRLHAALPSRAGALSGSTCLDLRRDVAAALDRSVARQIHRTISALRLFLHDCCAFVSNELAVWPVTAFEFGEYQHAFVADFKGVKSGHLREVRASLIIILDEIIVQFEMQIVLWNLVLHDDCVRNSANDGRRLLLEKFDVFGFVEARVPGVTLAILGALDDEYDLFRLHVPR